MEEWFININIKEKNYFLTKDSLPECFQSHIVYLFKCIGFNACYVGHTHTHLTTRIAQHFDKESSVFNHLNNNRSCKEKCNKPNCFKILDNGNSTYQLAIRGVTHKVRNKFCMFDVKDF